MERKYYRCPKCHSKLPESMILQAYGKNWSTCWNCSYHGEVEVCQEK